MIEIDKILINKIIAILPIYLDTKGNSTKIIIENKEDMFIYSRTIRVLKSIAGYFTLDLRKVRNEYGKIIESKNMVPIPLTKRDILIPMKTRKPISKNDGSIGYFNLKYIEDILKKDEDIYIKFITEREIKVLNSERTIIKHINDGRLVKQAYKEKLDSHIKEQNVNYNTPATKEDIALLIRELVDIKKRL